MCVFVCVIACVFECVCGVCVCMCVCVFVCACVYVFSSTHADNGAHIYASRSETGKHMNIIYYNLVT